MKISVIMPFVNEWPQIVFTIRTVREQLEGKCNYEIVAVDNFCEDVEKQGVKPDRGHDHYVRNKQNLGYCIPEENRDGSSFCIGHIMAQSRVNSSWLKCFKYEEKLSHWNAKNVGVRNSTGDVLLFLDAHVVPSANLLCNAMDKFCNLKNKYSYRTTLHLPLSYHILEDKRLMYKLIYEPEKGNVHYSFTRMPIVNETIEVPCMSTCGMFMTRKFFDELNGWPVGMGIYGGGENYINFTMAILNARKFIYPYGCLHHHGDRRDYSWNWTDYHRNRMIATWIFGGNAMLEKYQIALGNNENTRRMMRQAFRESDIHCSNMTCDAPQINIDDWVKRWEGCRAIGEKTNKRYE